MGAPLNAPFRALVTGSVSPAWRTALRDIGATLIDDGAWDLLVPPMGRGSRRAVATINPGRGQVVAVLRGADALASKRALWACLVTARGTMEARRIIPETFLLDAPYDANRLAVAHHEGDRWVLKHPLRQGRQGVRLLGHPREARPWIDDGWVVLQRFVDNGLTRGGHRLHVRRYLVVVIDRGRVSSWLADFGKCIYAREPAGLEPDTESVMTTSTKGWCGPPGVPQTWHALANALRSEGRDIAAIDAALEAGLVACVDAAAPLLEPANLSSCRTFQIFGIDVLLDANLHPWILEANKRPEMRPRGGTDGDAKVEVLRHTFRLGLGRSTDGFRKLAERVL